MKTPGIITADLFSAEFRRPPLTTRRPPLTYPKNPYPKGYIFGPARSRRNIPTGYWL